MVTIHLLPRLSDTLHELWVRLPAPPVSEPEPAFSTVTGCKSSFLERKTCYDNKGVLIVIFMIFIDKNKLINVASWVHTPKPFSGFSVSDIHTGIFLQPSSDLMKCNSLNAAKGLNVICVLTSHATEIMSAQMESDSLSAHPYIQPESSL